MKQRGVAARALVVMEIDGEVFMLAIIPSLLEYESEVTEFSPDGVHVEYRATGGGWVRIEGRLYQRMRSWRSWEDFYGEMGVRQEDLPHTRDALPADRLRLPAGGL